MVLKEHPNRLPSLLHWIFSNQILFLAMNQDYVIKCAVMNSSLRTTPSFVKIAMLLEVESFFATSDGIISY